MVGVSGYVVVAGWTYAEHDLICFMCQLLVELQRHVHYLLPGGGGDVVLVAAFELADELTGLCFGREALSDSDQSERAYGLLEDTHIVLVDRV